MSDIRVVGARYAEAWTSHAPDAVASFYEPDGRITINGGEPSVGRSAVAEMAKAFYAAFPDLIVRSWRRSIWRGAGPSSGSSDARQTRRLGRNFTSYRARIGEPTPATVGAEVGKRFARGG